MHSEALLLGKKKKTRKERKKEKLEEENDIAGQHSQNSPVANPALFLFPQTLLETCSL